ncbi:MAG: TonB-dependent receptor [Pseudomonadota bacterium]
MRRICTGGIATALCGYCVLSVAATQDLAPPAAAELNTVIVTGKEPTSLPWAIPTTIESLAAEQIAQKINATDAEDALKYFPSLLVRKRYIGDYDHAILASRASGTGNSARSMVYADGILLSNLLGNGATFTPRWGMVTPEEIERVAVLYGPFSAAYPGNSVGAVVDYITRMPDSFEAHLRGSAFGQHFATYRTDGNFSGFQGSVSVGDRFGDWSLWMNYNRLDNDGQPLVFANKLVSAGTAGTAGAPVTGAVAGRNPRNQDWLLIGATNQTHTVQDHAKLKVAYDFSASLRATYTLGAWRNEAVRSSDSYLKDAAGLPVYGDLTNATTSYAVNIGGRRYTLAPTDFAPSRGDLAHFIHGLSVRSSSGGVFDWELAASLYDYSKDQVRSPTIFLADADTHGAGRIADLQGTGWHTLALKGTWRPAGLAGTHLVDFGYQRDAAKLRSAAFATADWIAGSEGAVISLFAGQTTLQSLYVQDTWTLAADWRATLGVRGEEWRAFDGALGNASTVRPFAERRERYLSPKLALSWQLTDAWVVKASAGRAVRMPTVSELYQGTLTAGEIVNNDPNLRPERSWTGELTAQRQLDRGVLRTTLFHEDTRDSLYSQVNVAAGGTVATVQNVDHIRTTGLETVYDVSGVPLSRLDLQASFIYAHSRIVANDNFPASVGKWQPRIPEWRGSLLATWHFGEKWTTTLGARYSGKQFSQLDNSDTNGEAYTGVSRFFTLDARVRYRPTPKLTASLGVDNLNAEKYWNFHLYPMRSYALELSYDF